MVFMHDMTMSKKLPQYVAAIVVCIAAASIGTLLGWTSPTQSRLIAGSEYNFSISEDEFSWISSLFTLGAACMAIPSGPIINKFGPKIVMLALVVPMTVAWVLLIWAQNVIMMCVARFILGMVAGAYCVTCPMYITEIAQKEIRGILGSFFQLLLVSGVLIVYVIGPYVTVMWITTICAIIPLVFAVLLVFMPESPTFLVKNNKTGSAIESLQWLRGKQYDYKSELETIQQSEAEIKENKLSITQILSRKSTVRGLIISLGLMFFQQCSGVNAVIFYGAEIFEKANTGIDKDISQMVVGAMQVIATSASVLLVDKAGRRILLIVSGVVMAISLAALGTFFYLQSIESPVAENIALLPVISLCLFIIMFSFGFGPVPWLMMGEIFASDVRGVAGSFTATMNWICAFIVTKIFNTMQDGIGAHGTFWVYTGVAVASVFFVIFFVPETKGKSLEEIQAHLEGKSATNSNAKNSTVTA